MLSTLIADLKLAEKEALRCEELFGDVTLARVVTLGAGCLDKKDFDDALLGRGWLFEHGGILVDQKAGIIELSLAGLSAESNEEAAPHVGERTLSFLNAVAELKILPTLANFRFE